jgi:hypothetical protein
MNFGVKNLALKNELSKKKFMFKHYNLIDPIK